jgi:uncharacterized membrane protein YeaQ/YmgE (transglycosylase-associated protein family)
MHHLIAFQTPGEPTVTITFQPSQVLTWLIVGLIAGYLASALVRGGRMSLFGSLVVGLIGAVLGGIIFTFLRVTPPPALLQGITIQWIDIIVAFVGALIILLIFGGIFRRRRRVD